MLPTDRSRIEYYFEVNRSDGRGDIIFEQCPFYQDWAALKWMNIEREHLVRAYRCERIEVYTELEIALVSK